ncbi:hypothetical protein HUA76_08450 [Myxococcus sp. CA056]|uniref:hypothetical protein n=1 Tax=Myxococcus sp. CA056 TaxID=2741740 RepID=UPI00157A8C52|nr:hypothetical protein [Myxococcus sp. CA056]NTX10812.1 hypothetical protein [Myxococcus sp. CA056]
MTWRLLEQRPNLTLVGGDDITNVYSGDTTIDTLLPMLCLRQDGRPVPAGLVVDFYNGWAAGEVKLTAPLAGSVLGSRATADALCASRFGAGFRMAEFHDGQGGWHWWANGVVPMDTRFWAAINNQPANAWNSTGTIPPAPPVTPSTLPAVSCYNPSGAAVDCISGCGAVTCRDINNVAVHCASSANASQNCPPARCYTASGVEVNCATECDIARCASANGTTMPCPTEYAYCYEGPTLCTSATGIWDQQDDCDTPESDVYTCLDNGTNCASATDDPGDADDSTNTMTPLTPPEVISLAPSDIPSVETNSSCACASGNGRTTDCAYELRLISFKPTSASAFDRRMEVRNITVDAGAGKVELVDKYIAPEKLPVGYEVGINKTVATVPVPCGTTKFVNVTVAATEEDRWGPDEKGSVTFTLPLNCPGGAPVKMTQKMQFKNRRGRVKHEADFTVEARVGNRCATSTDLGTAPACAPPAGTPTVPCKFDLFLESLTHRDSPAFDRKGQFFGEVSPPGFPVVDIPKPTLSNAFGIREGTSKDLRQWYTSPIATYNVPYGGTMSQTIPVRLEEIDFLFGIGRNDKGNSQFNLNLTCPPTQDTFFTTTEVKLFGGNTSNPKHVVDLGTRTTLTNLNFGHVEATEGAVTPCQVSVKMLRARQVSGAVGNFDLKFRIGGKEASRNFLVKHSAPTWETPPQYSTLANVTVPCARRVETTLSISGREADAFSGPEFAYTEFPLTLSCANGAQADELKTVRLHFKNRRGSVRDILDVDLAITRTESRPACQCRQAGPELGRISTWWGKVNLHKSPGGDWLTDSDCSTGANVYDLNYCRKFWPTATTVTEVPVTPKPANVWRTGGCGIELGDFDGEKEYVCW